MREFIERLTVCEYAAICDKKKERNCNGKYRFNRALGLPDCAAYDDFDEKYNGFVPEHVLREVREYQ